VYAVVEDRLARRTRIGEHGGIDVHDDLVALARGPGSIPWWSALSASKPSASACCWAMVGGSAETSAGNVPAGT